MFNEKAETGEQGCNSNTSPFRVGLPPDTAPFSGGFALGIDQ